MAKQQDMTRSDLIRYKTIYRRLPRRTTRIAAQTYWQLAHIANNLNQLALAANTAVKMGQPLTIDPDIFQELKEVIRQARRELVELDLLAQLEDTEKTDDWEANQR